MSKLNNWGRWLVSGIFVAQAVFYLWRGTHIIRIFTHGENGRSFDAALEFVLAGMAFAICRWGIFNRRNWAYVLALVLCGAQLLITGLALLVEGSEGILPYSLLIISVLTWLLLPSVRAAYWQRERLA